MDATAAMEGQLVLGWMSGMGVRCEVEVEGVRINWHRTTKKDREAAR